jgi:hypothetical protein
VLQTTEEKDPQEEDLSTIHYVHNADTETDMSVDIIDEHFETISNTEHRARTNQEVKQKAKTLPLWVREFFYNIFRGLVKRKLLSGIIILAIAIVSWILSLGACYPCLAHAQSSLTTSFTRLAFGQGHICGTFSKYKILTYIVWDTICFTYLTVPQDISTSIIVNHHYYGDQTDYSQVFISKNSMNLVQGKVSGADTSYRSTCFRMDAVHDESRYQCWTDITGLEPSTSYYYMTVVTLEGKNVTSGALKFRTGPTNGNATFVAGGGLQWTRDAYALAQHARSQEPLFAFLGGDISLDNGNANCYRDWDKWFTEWQHNMITPSGHYVPLLTSVGDNEASSFRTPRSWNAFYIRYFPHEIGLQSKAPQQRDLHHEHIISNHTVMMVLDSGIHTTPAYQTIFLEHALQLDNFKNRLVGYHLPMYPSTEPNGLERSIINEMRDEWEPVMDHHNVSFAFENHYQKFKITKKMLYGKPDKDGTIFVGDGAWGATSNREHYDEFDTDYIEAESDVSNMAIVTVSDEGTCVLVVASQYSMITPLTALPVCS